MSALYAVKGNKQLKIDEATRQRYLNLGYDIAEDRGGKLEIVQHSPSKTVPYAQYEKLLKENEQLKVQLAQAAEKAFDPIIEGSEVKEPRGKTKGKKE